jgi:hypothetical protein
MLQKSVGLTGKGIFIKHNKHPKNKIGDELTMFSIFNPLPKSNNQGNLTKGYNLSATVVSGSVC